MPISSSEKPAAIIEARPVQGVLKRAMDLVVGSAALVVFSPAIAFTALRIKREDGGPVFYRAPRVGKDGRPFRMFKFRTMVVNADRIGGASPPAAPPRAPRVGDSLPPRTLVAASP